MDTIRLKTIKTQASIGVYAWERQVLQPLTLDVCFALPQPASTDLVFDDNVIDYAQLLSDIKSYATAQHYELIEHFAAGLADQCRQAEIAQHWPVV